MAGRLAALVDRLAHRHAQRPSAGPRAPSPADRRRARRSAAAGSPRSARAGRAPGSARRSARSPARSARAAPGPSAAPARGGGCRRPRRPLGIGAAPVARADDREVDDVVAGRPEPPEDPPLLGDRAEQLVLAADRLGRAEEQVPALAQREVEQADEALLDLGLEIDQQVAAADQVEARERRVLQQVLRREGDRLPERLPDAVGVVLLLEPALEALGRDVLGDAAGIDAAARRRPARPPRRRSRTASDRRSCRRPPPARTTSIAIEYASSPVEQPGTQTRIDRAGRAAPARSGAMTLSASACQASGSRKNPVTLIVRSPASALASCGSSRRRSM